MTKTDAEFGALMTVILASDFFQFQSFNQEALWIDQPDVVTPQRTASSHNATDVTSEVHTDAAFEEMTGPEQWGKFKNVIILDGQMRHADDL